MLNPAGARWRAIVSGLALAAMVLALLGGSVVADRSTSDKAGLIALTRAQAQPPLPVVPEPVEPVTLEAPHNVADLPRMPDDPVAVTPALSRQPIRASVVVDVAADQISAVREALAGLEGVEVVASVTLGTVDLGGVPAEIAAVDPAEFRPLTPQATAESDPLWDRVVAGDVAVSYEFGQSFEVPLGSEVAVGPADDPVRVGAFASNGTPPVADAIIALDRVAVLGPDTITRVLVGLAREASPTATVEALEDAGFTAQEIPDPRLPRQEVIIPEGGITPENVWDHLALCESSGNWQINTGNGYYGGVQFLPESWEAVGGTGLPHEHTREEQIYRATLLWQIQGWEAWPQCARKLGLIVDPPPSELPAPPSEDGQT